MKSPIRPVAVLIAAASLGLSAAAAPLWRLDFNHLPEGPAPQRLEPHAPAEVMVTRFLEQPEGSEPGRVLVVKSDGPDGGMALHFLPGAVQNGAGYVTPHRPGWLDTLTITYEALVKPDLVKTPSRHGYQILNNQPGGSIPQSLMSTDGVKTVTFTNAAGVNVRGSLSPGRWSHVAGVYTLAAEVGGESRLRLYINGKLVGEETFARPAGRALRALGLGRYLQRGKSDSFQGLIDAIAVSDEALEPGRFVLPLPR